MTIAHDAQTRFPATDGTSGTNSVDTTTGDRTFNHSGAASAKGAVVVLFYTGTTDVVTGVLYGGVAMTLRAQATDTSEAGQVDIYTLDNQETFPTGTQTVTLQGCTATGKWVTCSTVTCSVGPRSKFNAGNVTNTTTAANPTVSVVTTETTLLYGGCHGGQANPATYAPTANYTGQFHNDYGALSARSARRTSEVAAGTIVYNFTAASDDYCVAAVALQEYDPPPLELIQELDGTSQVGNQTFTMTLAQVDDLIVLIQADDFYTLANLLTPTGTAVTTWAEQTANGLPVDGGTNDNHAKVWTGTVTTAGGTVIANRTNTDDEGYAAVFVFRGLDGTPEFDTGDGTDSDANATAHVAPSVTPTAGRTDDILMCVFGTLNAVTNYTMPGGAMIAYTEHDVGGINTYRAGSEVLTSDSATGTRTATSSTNTTWFAVSALVRTGGAAPIEGQASAALVFTATAVGVPTVVGAASAAIGFTAAALGVPTVVGQASGAFGFTATALGVVTSPTVEGQATAHFTYTATASGIPTKVGLASAALGFTATAAGVPTKVGLASGAFTYTATASGVPTVVGAASGAFGFIATANGVIVGVVTGQASAPFTYTATAQGVPTKLGQATATLSYTATAAGVTTVLGQAAAPFTYTATALGIIVPPIQGQATAAFTYTANAVGVVISSAPVAGTSRTRIRAAATTTLTIGGVATTRHHHTPAAATAVILTPAATATTRIATSGGTIP